MDELTFVEYDVMCETEGCGNAGHMLRVVGVSIDPFIECGVCVERITNVTLVELNETNTEII